MKKKKKKKKKERKKERKKRDRERERSKVKPVKYFFSQSEGRRANFSHNFQVFRHFLERKNIFSFFQGRHGHLKEGGRVGVGVCVDVESGEKNKKRKIPEPDNKEEEK